MLSKCANPECSNSFHYLHQGKLFRMETLKHLSNSAAEIDQGMKKPVRQLEFFWLCSDCASKMTLVFRPGVGVQAQPLAHAKGAAS
jgi:hypothetical protein